MKCYLCKGNMTLKTIEIMNGDKSKPEKAVAFVCEECGERILSADEVKRLQDLACQVVPESEDI